MPEEPTFLDPEFYQYMLKHSVRPHDLLNELHLRTQQEFAIPMQSHVEQLNFLGWFVKLINAKRILEIGTYTGMSALAMAEQLPDDGELICLDHSNQFTSLAKEYWVKGNVSEKIDCRIGEALESLQVFTEQDHESFDLVFIDADKANCKNYYELCLPLIKVGGVLIIDNVFFDRRILDDNNQKKSTNGIREINEFLVQDERVDLTMLPLSDGMTLARKR
jgi:predicted O-methyltransferase YrrM